MVGTECALLNSTLEVLLIRIELTLELELQPHSSSTTPTPNSSAAAAASQAFMKNQQSNASLSAAAAATALRSHFSTPIQVGDVQTKRMQRRGSVSSNGSAPSVGRPSGQLQRRESAGSMTERTFRSRSPSPAASPIRKAATVPHDAPPMPTIPQTIPEIPPKSHKRATSLENQIRITSPTPQPGGRGVSLDRANPPVSSGGQGSKQLAKITELDREGSQRSSVNFSRPMSPTNAPQFAAQIRPKSQGGWFSGPAVSHAQPRKTPFERPKTAIGITPADASSIQQAIQIAADRPVAPKKKKRFSTGVEGSRLAAGTMSAKPTGTAVQPDKPLKQPPTQAVEAPVIQAAVPSPGSTSGGTRSPVDSSSEASPTGRQPKAAGVLVKQPSVVREQPELEKQAEDTPSANTGRKIDASQIRSPTDAVRPASFAIPTSAHPNASQQRSMRSASEDLGRTGSVQMAVPEKPEREASVSPSRTPHFSLVPIHLEGGRKHQPPPRSVSPVKSALKHSPSSSIRTASPVASPPGGRGTSASPARSQSPQHKKAARVSFDDGPATIIPGLESSKHAPPNSKSKVVEEPDFEDVYTPRPALPSFGSIRGRKREEDEPVAHPKPVEKLVQKPVENPVEEPVEPEPSSVSSSKTLVDLGHSKDHAIGGILTQDFATKAAAKDEVPQEPEGQKPKISDNLPLPPEVTSVEGSGYVSDSDASAYDESIPPTPMRTGEEPAATDRPMSPEQREIISAIESPPTTESKAVQVEAIAPTERPEADTVPEIAVHPATPSMDRDEPDFLIPGAFPSAWESSQEVDKQGLPAEDITSAQVQVSTTAPPQSVSIPAATVPAPSIQVPAKEQDDSESDNESIYSDAAEDPSELYSSIDAVLSSPVSPPGLAISTDRPTPSSSTQVSPIQARGEAKAISPASEWDDATKYWRGLNDKKKREIEEQAETQAAPDDESEAEPIVVVERPPTPPKPKKKKNKAIPAAVPGSSNQDAAVSAAIQQAQAQSASRPTVVSPEPRQPMLKKSMRPQHERSFSDEGPRPMPTTLRGPKKGLESSKYAPQQEARGALQKKHIPTTRPATSAGIKTTAPASPTLTKAPIPPSMQLPRRGSGDSESSFKRSRPVMAGGEEAVTLRRTLRQPAPIQTTPAPKTKTSPRGQPEPTSPPPHQMRMSLRQSVESEPRSFRPQEKKKRRSALSPTRLREFGRTSRDKAKAVATAATPSIPTGVAQKFRSRFSHDSDDEEAPEQGPRVMESRFEDSDDDLDSPEGLPPVRGIPKTETDVASELLPGEDDSDINDDDRPPMPTPKEMEAATKLARERLAAQGAITAKGAASGAGNSLATGTLRGKGKEEKTETLGLAASKHAPPNVKADRPSHKRRWSLFSLGKEKKAQRNSSLPPVPTAAVGDEAEAGPSSPGLSKLQRRVTPTGLPHLTEEDSWPLPAPPSVVDDDDRPNTSDGVPAATGVRFSERPDIGKRRSTADDLGEALGGRKRLSKSYEPVVSQRTGKVKRFGRLRRAFGLKD